MGLGVRELSLITRLVSLSERMARRLHIYDNEKTTKLLQWNISKFRLHKRAKLKDNKTIYRWEIFWCELGENIGSEETKRRPCVIIQNQKGNDNAPTTIVAPITNATINLPIAVPLNRGEDSDLTGTIDLGQIRVISKGRIYGESVGKLTNSEQKKVEQALIKSVGLFNVFKKEKDKFEQKQKYANQLNDLLKDIKNELNITDNKMIIDEIKKLKK